MGKSWMGLAGTALMVGTMGVTGAAQGMGAPGGGRGAGMAPPAHLVEEVQRMYTTIMNNIANAADAFPEDKYTWQPTPEVRSWARLVGHVTDDNNVSCWQMAGLAERPAVVDMPNSAESGANKIAKADLVAGLRASIELCGKAFAEVSPQTMSEPSGGRGGQTKMGLLIYNTSHTNEHYGNMVTYMRLQNLVPPSSQGRGGAGMRGRGM